MLLTTGCIGARQELAGRMRQQKEVGGPHYKDYVYITWLLLNTVIFLMGFNHVFVILLRFPTILNSFIQSEIIKEFFFF